MIFTVKKLTNNTIIETNTIQETSYINDELYFKNFIKEKIWSDKHCKCPQFLIVDDNTFNILVIKNYCKKYNLIFDEALNGK